MSGYLHLPSAASCNTPNHASFNVTDLDFAYRGTLPSWAPAVETVIADRAPGDPNRQFRLSIQTDGKPKLLWFPTGSIASLIAGVSTVAVPFTDNRPGWIRCTLDVDNGSSGYDLKFWYSTQNTNDSASVSWTQLGLTVVGGAVTNLAAVTSSLTVSYPNGSISDLYHTLMYDGIAGTTVFDADFTDLTLAEAAAGSFVEDSANAVTVTINGSNWRYVRPYMDYEPARQTGRYQERMMHVGRDR